MRKRRLLIVDNNVNLTLLYRQELEDDGYRVDVANTVRSAGARLEIIKYDLIIVEPMMMRQKELEEFGNNLNDRKHPPVIFNTGNYNFVCGQGFSEAEVCIKSSDLSSLKLTTRVLLEQDSKKRKSGGFPDKEVRTRTNHYRQLSRI
jgi:DNA-binding NtrC family response regulator